MANGLFMKVANRAIYFNILDSKHLVIKEKIKDNVAKYLTDCIEDVGRPLTLKPTKNILLLFVGVYKLA